MSGRRRAGSVVRARVDSNNAAGAVARGENCFLLSLTMMSRANWQGGGRGSRGAAINDDRGGRRGGYLREEREREDHGDGGGTMVMSLLCGGRFLLEIVLRE